MKIGMLENGMDSLKRGFQSFLQYKVNTEGKTPTLQDYLLLKQAILNTHHGVEILLKFIVQKKSEFLIIQEIDSNYRKAYLEKEKSGFHTVFNTSLSHKIHTIVYEEAIDRAKDFCGVQISQDVDTKLRDLNDYRNALTHAEIDIDDERIEALFDGLLIDLDILFVQSIGEEYEAFYGFSEVKANYDQYMKYYDREKLSKKKEAVEAYTKAIEKNGMYAVGIGDIAYTEDTEKAKVFLKLLQKNLDFGMDLFNGYCSGKAKMKMLDDGRVSIWAYDNNDEYICKFKSLILFVPEYKSNVSPILILESADDIVDADYEKYVYDDMLDGLYIGDHIEYDTRKIQEFYNRCDYDESFVAPKHYGVCRFLKGRIFGCFNVQGLKYWNFRVLLKAAEDKSGSEFKKLLEELIRRSQKKDIEG